MECGLGRLGRCWCGVELHSVGQLAPCYHCATCCVLHRMLPRRRSNLLHTMPETALIPPMCAAAYAAKKAELAEERRRREAEREAAKEARKQRMRDYMEKNLLEVGDHCVLPFY